MSTAAPRAIVADPTVYPVKDDMGDPTLQTFISILLVGLLRGWLTSRGKPTFVGMNQFFYWKQFEPTECVAPDVYVLPGVPLWARAAAWKVWETGKVPTFALEVVSRDVDKDYLTSPPKYDRLGVKELVIFDPDFTAGAGRVRWQVYRRVGKRGLSRVEAHSGDRVKSSVLGCWLRAVGAGDQLRVRLGTGPNGDTLVPTDEEARAEAESGREQERAAREQAEAAREQAEAEVARLRAELTRARKQRT